MQKLSRINMLARNVFPNRPHLRFRVMYSRPQALSVEPTANSTTLRHEVGNGSTLSCPSPPASSLSFTKLHRLGCCSREYELQKPRFSVSHLILLWERRECRAKHTQLHDEPNNTHYNKTYSNSLRNLDEFLLVGYKILTASASDLLQIPFLCRLGRPDGAERVLEKEDIRFVHRFMNKVPSLINWRGTSASCWIGSDMVLIWYMWLFLERL